MVPGLEPMEAVDRLKKFQQLFEVWYSMHVNDQVSKHGLQQQSPHLSFAAHSLPVCCALHRRLQPHHHPLPPDATILLMQVRKRKWENYSSGEELFGLQVTSYPELEQTEKEVTMLDRLYRWVRSLKGALCLCSLNSTSTHFKFLHVYIVHILACLAAAPWAVCTAPTKTAASLLKARTSATSDCAFIARSLYVTVISTIRGYGDFFWVDVVEKVDEWGEQVLQYQAQCKKLPKALRDWQAYVDCRDTIDNFLELLPLFQALASKAMRERHWQSLMQITGVCVCACVHVYLSQRMRHLARGHRCTTYPQPCPRRPVQTRSCSLLMMSSSCSTSSTATCKSIGRRWRT